MSNDINFKIGDTLKCINSIRAWVTTDLYYTIYNIDIPLWDNSKKRIYFIGNNHDIGWIPHQEVSKYFELKLIKTILPLP